jgi:hypothetical protein
VYNLSIFSKLAFWKKGESSNDEFGLGNDPMMNFGDNMGNSQFNSGFQQQPKVPKAFEEEVDPTGGSYSTNFAPKNYAEAKRPADDFFQPQKPFSVATSSSDSSYHAAKDFEIVSSKLDALRAAIESINQRLINVEDLLRREKKDKDRYW